MWPFTKRESVTVADAAPPAAGPARAGDGMANVVAGLGTSRDKNYWNEWLPVVALGRPALENMFRGSWLARRIVTTKTNDMTREWISITWKDRAKDEEGPKALKKAEAQFGVKRKFNEAIRWARLHGGAAIVIGIKGQDLATPLDVKTVKKDSLQYLRVFDRWRLQGAPGQLDEESDVNFGMPLFYMLDSQVKIHWSRVVRFNGDPLPYDAWRNNQMWDDSVLQAAISSVNAYTGVTQGISSMIWESNVDIIRVKGFFDLIGTKAGEEKLVKRFAASALMKSFNRLLLIDKDEEYQQKETHFAGVVATIGEFRQDLSGACDVPITRLWGQSPAGMNATGESDLTNYYDSVAGLQETDVIPQATRVYDVLIPSTLGHTPDEVEITANSLWQMSDTEKATLQKLRADRDHIYLVDGVITEGVVAKQLHADNTYPDSLTEEDVELAEALALEPEPVPPVLQLGPDGKPLALPPVPPKPGAKAEAEGEPGSEPPDADGDGVPDDKDDDDAKAADNAPVVESRTFQGMNIAVEYKAGTVRTWRDDAGNEIGHTVMKYDYGYFVDFMGADGQELDVYIGPHADASNVYIIHQRKVPGYKVFDEDKVVMGVRTPNAAIEAFLGHRHDGDQAYGGMNVKTVTEFKAQLKRRKSTGKIRG